MVRLSPSIMCADLLRLGRDIEILERSGVELFHADVMDGHCVRNFGLPCDLARAVKGVTSLPIDALEPFLVSRLNRPDFLTLLMVEPGFAGQAMITSTKEKLKRLREKLRLLGLSTAGSSGAVVPVKLAECVARVRALVDESLPGH